MPDPTAYQWIDDALSDAACVTAVAGATGQEVLAAFGADTSISLGRDDAYGYDKYTATVAVHDVPGGVVALELNGFQGSLEPVLGRLSRLGPAASIFWNVNDDNAFTCARDGALVATVDMYDAEDPDDVDLPDDLMSLFVQADDEDASMWAVGMAMVEAFTAVRIGEKAVAAAGPFHPIPGV
ncbi:MAG TPA: DUF6461 domain-containing protein [Nocardioides sp.]|uniref:DUF6461 domain-containing protein n=1 Tax=Nocardioides sp. TaxID=35761 RepID=UPI002C501FDF|nr:DUF6461 domain-containing protein [Nocardioides sp.]HTW13962.1 DUF6461 domain-containing protein [Nocardioides sp.]